MNTKRQTVWLVSMLSLMVVLSAYYLFTQDLDSGKSTASEVNGISQTGDEVISHTKQDQAVDVDQSIQSGASYTISQLDQAILNQLESEGYPQSSTFSELLTKREQQYEDAENRIMSVIANVSSDQEASVAALAEMEWLEEKNSRIAMLESELMEVYDVALVAEEQNEKYKVVVTSDLLEKKEAAVIIDKVIAVLEAKPEQVSVQFVQAP